MYEPKMRFHSPAPCEEDDTDSKNVVEEPLKRSKKKGLHQQGMELVAHLWRGASKHLVRSVQAKAGSPSMQPPLSLPMVP